MQTLNSPRLKTKPIIATRENTCSNKLPSITNGKTITMNCPNHRNGQEETHTTQNKDSLQNNTVNNNQLDTIRVVECITDSKDIVSNTNIKALTIIAEPSDTIIPSYTINYASIHCDHVKDIIKYDTDNSKSIQPHLVNINDDTIYITEILFQFTEIETGQNWYYCHYLDLNLHSNIILLSARDVPQNLLHQFINEHDIKTEKHNNCKQCQKNCNTEGQSIGYYAPCYIHKHKQNKQYHHVKDHVELIKNIQKTCQKANKQSKKLKHNPPLHTVLVDKKKNLYCTTVLPTNDNHLPIKRIEFERVEDSETTFGVSTTSITMPNSIECDRCNQTHQPTISYNIYNEAFICDRCGYGQNPFDIIYRASEQNTCTDMDICCNCAIKIANAQNEDHTTKQ